MYVIVLASQKGGTGKTTLSSHLAIQAERAGFGPVVLLDTDPQAGLSAWWNVRKAETPPLAKIQGSLVNTLKELSKAGVRVVFIDTPPALGASITATVAQADLVIIPCKPSPNDLRAIGGTIEITRSVKKPMIFVLNMTRFRTRMTADAAVALSQHGTVSPTMIDDLQEFRSSMTDGRTATELDDTSKASQKIRELWVYIANRMEMKHGTAA